ncbi:hypothetical protein ABZ092_16095 [Streptomyces bobili]|uniref:hypothetical protein n=1 Tax=Streptomyces bobili TaxID=67280 RepID=UPI0033A77346
MPAGLRRGPSGSGGGSSPTSSTRPARSPVTLIAPAGVTAAHFPEAQILNASLSEPQHLDHVDADITVQRLEHTAYQQITTALKVSGQPSHPAGP